MKFRHILLLGLTCVALAACNEEKKASPPPPPPPAAVQAAPVTAQSAPVAAPVVVDTGSEEAQSEPDYSQAPPPPPPVDFAAPAMAPTFELAQLASYLEATHSRDLRISMQLFEDALNQHYAGDGYVEVYPEAWNGRYLKITGYINKVGTPGFHPGVDQVLFTITQTKGFFNSSTFYYEITGYDWSGRPLQPTLNGSFYAPEMAVWVNGYFVYHTMAWTPYYTNYNRVYYTRNTYIVSHPNWRVQNQGYLRNYSGPAVVVHPVVAPRVPVVAPRARAVNPAVSAPRLPAPTVGAPHAPAVVAPVVKQAAPVSAAPAPVAKPVVAPVVKQAAPVSVAPAPVAKPVVAPVVKQAAPVSVAPAPVVKQAAPVSVAPAPVAKPAPVVKQAAPVSVAPAPRTAPAIRAPTNSCFNRKKC